ncbi:hypothetical protein K0651_05960 [Ornithinimicrobium sp. Arc0846-15]|nr:hypothetical protein [Ornithinimicrobium laminariae]
MTTATQSQTSTSRRPAQWQRATKIQLQVLMGRALWFFAMATVFVALAIVTISQFIDLQMSVAQFAYQGTLWFQFAMMITVFVWYSTVHVTNGLTRRSLVIGSLLAGAGSALFYAVAITVMLLVERWVYSAFGWSHGLTDLNGEVFANGWLPYLWGAVLIFIAGNLSGLLIAATYYRVGGWRGTLWLPLTISPLPLMSFFVLDAATQWTPFEVTVDAAGALRPLIALAIVAAASYAYYLLVRRMPIRAQTT